MQARAVFEAAADVAKKKIKVKPEIMIPLVGFKKEFDLQAEIVHRVAQQVMTEKKVKFDYLVGTMIEVPRGALTADQIAQSAEFFSFGTNDLTQMALGISRDDMGISSCLTSRTRSSRRTRSQASTRPGGPAHANRRR
jgi:Phosphoenolpyruvate synthase/pyruvate phosphate dikinase